MATFEYAEIPADAVRLKQASLEPAPKIFTSLPDATPAPPCRPGADQPLSPAKAALALVPQMLLSASLPPTAGPAPPALPSPPHALLSTRDPLSVPVMTSNFRRFVSRVGPVFWIQDRVEEIVLWKKGWKRTAVWLAAYAFFCYFPRMALLIPHVVLLGLMLAYYPDPGTHQVPIHVGEGSTDWQSNIQAIQNLMGAFSDMYDAVVPCLPLLVAPSAPLESMSRCTPSTPALQPHHPLLIVTFLSFLGLIPILMTNLLPLRLLFFLAGTGTVVALHPCFRGPLSKLAQSSLSGTGPGLSFQLAIRIPRLPHPLSLAPLAPPRSHTFVLTIAPRDVHLFIRQCIDNDRLDDAVWRAPLSHVELWENERWRDATETKRRKSVATLVHDDDPAEDDAASTGSSATVTTPPVNGHCDAPRGSASTMGGTWSKTNLKPNERVGWTRGRDGWSGVGGQVSSNLTFSLSSGWAFVETEGWRADVSAAWAVQGTASSASVCVGADQDGWTYTTDTWTHPRPDGRPSEGWVTRRRRWVRRVYFRGVES